MSSPSSGLYSAAGERMKVDVFVAEEGDDGAGASLAVRALKARLKLPVGQLFLLAPKSERSERLAYDLGIRFLTRPPDLAGFSQVAESNGDGSEVLFWSAEAVLVSDWNPFQNNQLRMWETCPAALLRRTDLAFGGAATWREWQTKSTFPRNPLPDSQVKVLPLAEFEKAAHGSSWPFGPSVVMLEKTAPRR